MYTVQLHCVMSIHIVDINECLTDSGGCTQKCNNTVGSYHCSCWNGYELANDSHTCNGKHTERANTTAIDMRYLIHMLNPLT